MTKEETINMLLTMHEMTKQACEKAVFTEVSTYVKNHCPNIDPEFVEVFRDVIIPMSNENSKLNISMPTYLVLSNNLFQHIVTTRYGGINRPQNLYVIRRVHSGGIDLEHDLFTYEELISRGAKIPTDEELLKSIR